MKVTCEVNISRHNNLSMQIHKNGLALTNGLAKYFIGWKRIIFDRS